MVWEITTHELLARYRNGERNFAGVDILKAYRLDGSDIIYVPGLEGAYLSGINLRGANLEDVSFEGATLAEADLAGAYFLGGCLRKTDLRNANLNFSNLSCADCREANFGGARLERVNAGNANFTKAIDPLFGHSILAGANFKDSTLRKDLICREGNFIWDTIMPDGTVERDTDFNCAC